MPAARYEVVQTDARTGNVVAALPVASLSFQDTLNAEGSASVAIPLDCPEANPDVLFPGASGLVVLRDGEPEWGGLIWTLAADLDQGTLALNAAGYHSYYKGLTITDGYNRRADQAHLIRDWIELRNDRNGIGTDTSRLTTTGKLRTRKWTKYEFKNIAEAIEELAEDSDGFNFRYEPYWIVRGKRVGHRFIKSLRGGSPLGVQLEHTVNCNVTQVSYDSAVIATHTYAIGADNGNGTKLLAFANNLASGLDKRMPNKHAVTTFSDVKEQESLDAKARAMAAIGSAPIAIPALTLYPGLFAPSDFVPGNSGPVSVNDGYVRLLDDFVVTECKTDVDVNGTEVISLSLANKELFEYGDAS